VEAARPATTADLPTLVPLAQALRNELRALRGGALWETREAQPDPFDAVFERDDTHLVVGTIDDAVVGYGTVVVEDLRDGSRLGVITELYVEPEARAVGVGESIADALVAFCTAAGCAGVDATALPGDRTAKNFFERAGFTARSLTMHKRLPGRP
jgi:ribosomal protein S18 acetylase RimI-like enzyme